MNIKNYIVGTIAAGMAALALGCGDEEDFAPVDLESITEEVAPIEPEPVEPELDFEIADAPGGHLENTLDGNVLTMYFTTSSNLMHKNDITDLSNLVNTCPTGTFVLQGNADPRGDDNLNDKWGQKRADGVEEYLVDIFGIPSDKVTTISFGESQRVSQEDSLEAYKLDRRTEIIVSGCEEAKPVSTEAGVISRCLYILPPTHVYLIDATDSMDEAGKWRAVTAFDFEDDAEMMAFNTCVGVERARDNDISNVDTCGWTPLWDSAYKVIASERPDKITILTDGMDNRSRRDYTSVIRIAKEHDTKVYTIGVGPIDEQELINIAEETGGAYCLETQR